MVYINIYYIKWYILSNVLLFRQCPKCWQFYKTDPKVLSTTQSQPSKPGKPLWGMSCGSGVPTNVKGGTSNDGDIRQKLMLHGIGRSKRSVWIIFIT